MGQVYRESRTSDLVQRRFEADAPNRLWVADMTYVRTWAGFIFLAVVLDVFSRRVVGWAIGHDMNTDLVLKALNMALQQRKPRATTTCLVVEFPSVASAEPVWTGHARVRSDGPHRARRGRRPRQRRG